jgi:hypothetical protein
LDFVICRDAKYLELSALPPYPVHHRSPDDCAPSVVHAATPAASAATAGRYRHDRELLCDIGAVSYRYALAVAHYATHCA